MDYQELQDTLIKWLNREGFTELIATAPTFIAMAERRIARECDLSIYETILNTTTANTTVPDDWMRGKAMTIVQGENNFEVNGTPIKKVKQAGSNGRPLYYSTVGQEFFFGPTPDQEYTLEAIYYAAPELLSDTNTSNLLSEYNPELILWAALLEACLFLKDDQRAQVWEGRYRQLKQDTQASQEKRDFEGGSLQVRENTHRYLGNKRLY